MTDKHFCLDDSPHFQMLELEEVTSTNDYLHGYHPLQERRMTLVTTENQTAGRGSGSNHWESEKGKNLLFSILVHPRHVEAHRMFVLSEVLALAVREALTSRLPPLTPRHFSIKWPNDIYYDNHKVCGMLIENDLRGTCVDNCIMGVGININQTQFGSNVPNPTSLALILGKEIERRFVLEHVMEYFTRYYEWTEQGRDAELHEMYLHHLYRKGEKHGFTDKNGIFEGTITDVEPTGHLIIRDTKGQDRQYAFKEVQYII